MSSAAVAREGCALELQQGGGVWIYGGVSCTMQPPDSLPNLGLPARATTTLETTIPVLWTTEQCRTGLVIDGHNTTGHISPQCELSLHVSNRHERQRLRRGCVGHALCSVGRYWEEGTRISAPPASVDAGVWKREQDMKGVARHSILLVGGMASPDDEWREGRVEQSRYMNHTPCNGHFLTLAHSTVPLFFSTQ